jgi:hypothetical protein
MDPSHIDAETLRRLMIDIPEPGATKVIGLLERQFPFVVLNLVRRGRLKGGIHADLGRRRRRHHVAQSVVGSLCAGSPAPSAPGRRARRCSSSASCFSSSSV